MMFHPYKTEINKFLIRKSRIYQFLKQSLRWIMPIIYRTKTRSPVTCYITEVCRVTFFQRISPQFWENKIKKNSRKYMPENIEVVSKLFYFDLLFFIWKDLRWSLTICYNSVCLRICLSIRLHIQHLPMDGF